MHTLLLILPKQNSATETQRIIPAMVNCRGTVAFGTAGVGCVSSISISDNPAADVDGCCTADVDSSVATSADTSVLHNATSSSEPSVTEEAGCGHIRSFCESGTKGRII